MPPITKSMQVSGKKKVTPTSKPKRIPTARLKKKADSLFSIWIRQRGMDALGMNSCYTCGARMHWKALQCGHYLSRQHLAGRYNPDNCRSQDYRCNVAMEGNYPAYALNLVRECGEGILEKLEKLREPTQFKRQDYLNIISKYQ